MRMETRAGDLICRDIDRCNRALARGGTSL
jgi:hypothetical protein